MAAIDAWLLEMLDHAGSDLHLEATQPPRIRTHGRLQPLDGPALAPEAMAALLREICPAERWTRFLADLDIDFAYDLPGRARFRVNYFLGRNGAGAVLRLIPARVHSLEELHLPEVLRRICGYRRGLVVVTGPTGSGKSTTMAAMLDHINRTECRHMITIEDPVEFVHANHRSIVIHREVGEDCASFAAGLSSAMRGDPDLVLVGELRDTETMRLALDCAARGVLVFATLHTNSAPSTIDRVIDIFPVEEQDQARTVLAECLVGVVAQVLCRRADGAGRVAAHEILLYTDGLPNAIRRGQMNSVRTMIDGSAALGMCSLDRALKDLLAHGVITAAEAYAKANVKDEFAYLLGGGEVLRTR